MVTGLETICQVPSQLRIRLLLSSGWGQNRQIWALGQLDKNGQSGCLAFSDMTDSPGILCALVFSFFGLMFQAIVARATVYLDRKWYRLRQSYCHLRRT